EILEHVDATMDAQAAQKPMTLSELTDWINQKRTVAFWLEQVYRQMGKQEQIQSQSTLAAKWSAQARELRSLRDRANAAPPDGEARSRLEQIARTGRFE